MARDNRIDTIKGLLIILVILGHMIEGFDKTNFINHSVMGVIYMFHMPLFIIISGYLTKHPGQQSPSQLWHGVVNILVPLAIFQMLMAARIACLGGNFFTAMQRFPYGVLWYLLCLVYWRIALYYTPRQLLNRPYLHLGIALVLSLLVGVTRLDRLGTTWSLHRAISFYFFFLLGFYYRQGKLPQRWWHGNIVHAAVAVALLPTVFLLYPNCGNVMNGADHYGWSGLPCKVMVLICSTAMSLLVFNLMPDVKVLRPIGRDSLFYYLYHMIVMAIIITPAVNHFALPHTFPFLLLYTAVMVALLMLMSRVKFFRWLTHPTLKRGGFE